MTDDIYTKLENYICAHENTWLKDFPFVFFKRDHLIFAKEYLKIRDGLIDDQIKIAKEKNVESDNFHFPYYCGEFPDKVKSEECIEGLEKLEKFGNVNCRSRCPCLYSHFNWVYEDNYYDDTCDCVGITYYGNCLDNETEEEYAKRNKIIFANPYTYVNYFWGETDNDDITFEYETNCWNRCCKKTIIKKRYLLEVVQ